MWKIRIIFVLIASCLTFSVAIPSTGLDASWLVCGHRRSFTQGRPECNSLLEDLISRPWVHQPVSFGRTQPDPGMVPFRITTSTCDFALLAVNRRNTASETFRLIDYFPALWQINLKCLMTETVHNMGTTEAGRGGYFYFYLGAVWSDDLREGGNTSIGNNLHDMTVTRPNIAAA